MQSSQYPMQQNPFMPGKEYMTNNQVRNPGSIEQGLEAMHPAYKNTVPVTNSTQLNPSSVPADNNVYNNFQNVGVPPTQSYYNTQNFQAPQEQSGSNSNPKIMMALNYLQSHIIGQPNTGTPNISSMNTQPLYPPASNFPAQNNPSIYPYGMAVNPNANLHSQNYSYNQSLQDDQGRRNFGNYQDSNMYRNNGNGYKRDDREGEDRRDRRADRGRDDRGYKDNRDDRNDKRGPNNQSDYGKNRKADDFQKDRKSGRRSRSRSRSFEKRDSSNNRKGNYNSNSFGRDREGGDRYGGRDNYNKSSGNKFQKGNSFQNNEKSNNLDDWKCVDCGNVNWARREECNRCHVKRPENAPLIPKDSNNRGGSFHSKGGFDRKQNRPSLIIFE